MFTSGCLGYSLHSILYESTFCQFILQLVFIIGYIIDDRGRMVISEVVNNGLLAVNMYLPGRVCY